MPPIKAHDWVRDASTAQIIVGAFGLLRRSMTGDLAAVDVEDFASYKRR
jgi:hypothetical protein